jgi:DDE superfamily endonuclease
MITLPEEIMAVLVAFTPVFSERIWDWVQVLVAGAILAPKKRTVTSLLRATGMQDEKPFQNYHRILNRASWSSLEVSKILLGLLPKH